MMVLKLGRVTSRHVTGVGDVVVGFGAGHELGEILVEFFDLCAEVFEEGIAGPPSKEHDYVRGYAGKKQGHGGGCA